MNLPLAIIVDKINPTFVIHSFCSKACLRLLFMSGISFACDPLNAVRVQQVVALFQQVR